MDAQLTQRSNHDRHNQDQYRGLRHRLAPLVSWNSVDRDLLLTDVSGVVSIRECRRTPGCADLDSAAGILAYLRSLRRCSRVSGAHLRQGSSKHQRAVTDAQRSGFLETTDLLSFTNEPHRTVTRCGTGSALRYSGRQECSHGWPFVGSYRRWHVAHNCHGIPLVAGHWGMTARILSMVWSARGLRFPGPGGSLRPSEVNNFLRSSLAVMFICSDK